MFTLSGATTTTTWVNILQIANSFGAQRVLESSIFWRDIMLIIKFGRNKFDLASNYSHSLGIQTTQNCQVFWVGRV